MKPQQSLLQAYTLASSEQYDEALDLLSADKLLVSDETAIELRARILLENGDRASAKREWLNLLQINPENETAKEVLRNISGLRGWFWFKGKYYVAGLVFVSLIFGAFYPRKATCETSPVTPPSTHKSVYPEFVIPMDANTLTTASIQELIKPNKSENNTLLIFSEQQIAATIISDMAIDFGFPSDNIISISAKGDPSSVALLRIIEGQYKEFRYEH